ncbi:O-antigen ligase family protein [Bacillus cereus group sp. MYBK12-2]|jgi:O-antigen ligase|nr:MULTISPECIES: O-antigen ligase family protein [Bacillus cereus group]MCU9942846.1 O-antigen ligase family protein [Bacillus pacificus]MDR4257604.1 O-antigen ligase family protein [Bacillus pacificus]HDR3484043.1 O-antigen ligase family protein [Bacillus pacificus]HDR7245199.1 O-antigen ligase family protein [Bacillus pacificus]
MELVMEKFTLSRIINIIMFLYILSIYLFTFRDGLNSISNFLALTFIAAIWSNVLLTRKKIVFNKFLFIYFLFILVCFVSVFFAINQSIAVSKIKTIILIYFLMISLVNYIDTFEKLRSFLLSFVYSGFITGVYILASSDFSQVTRYGSELGNVNSIGMIIGISSIFCFYFIIEEKKYLLYTPIMLINIFVVFLTGSRKALLFVVLTIIAILLIQQKAGIKGKIKALIGILVTLVISLYVIFNVELLYTIIGVRMEHLFSYILGKGANEGSINIRANMIDMGLDWFQERPITGYGIDNFRSLYGIEAIGGEFTYSHNNLVELLVGIGIIGTFLFYLTHFIVLKGLYKESKKNQKSALCYSFIAIIGIYIILSVGLIYYYDKHISMILAIGSIIYKIGKPSGEELTQKTLE